jgi:hypothetical protein
MTLGVRAGAARWLAVLIVLSWVGVSHAQVDLAKVLVGRWEGEQEYLLVTSDNPKRILVIESVNQVDGKWIANGRYGTPAGLGRARIAIETGDKNVGLSWTGPNGNQFQLSLLQDKHLVGKVTLTTEQSRSGTGSRDRTLKLEKVN